MALNGKCACGAVGYTIHKDQREFGPCHCDICRAWTGGVFMGVQAGKDEATLTGEEHLSIWKSSEWAERGFCSECGSTLFYRFKEPEMYLMATGCFDDDELCQVAGEIYIDEKPSGYAFAGEHPRLTGAEFLASIGQSAPPE